MNVINKVDTLHLVEKNFSLAKDAFARRQYKTANIHLNGFASKVIEGTSLISKASSKKPKYSIIVVNYQVSDDFAEMIEFLGKYEHDPDYEIVIVNNGNEHLVPTVKSILSDCTLLNVGFNYGCSGGRNVGANYSRGEYLLFVDDDGILSEDAIEVLISTIEKYDAVTCRGKVIPKTENSLGGGNYDKGDSITISIPDAEGISVWKRQPFVEHGGFDPLLSGHEGLCLCSKMFKFYGPTAFLYTPYAVLYHDYASGKEHDERKRRLHDNNRNYLNYLGLPWAEINRTMKSAQENDIVLRKLNSYKYKTHLTECANEECKIAVITTAKNGVDFIEDYVKSLLNQSYQNFYVIFVDDGSEDDTVGKLKELWLDLSRITIVETAGVGRAAALNIAVSRADADICLIADVDDVSIEKRFELTVAYFLKNPGSGCVSFYCFNETDVMRAAKPFVPFSVSLKDRTLVGMPASFPTFAFRRSEFTEKFNEELSAGIDCDWIYRNFSKGASDGQMIPISTTYYRIHDKQITSEKREMQKQVALDCIAKLHTEILGEISEEDKENLALLSGWERIETGRQVDDILHYINKLAGKIEDKKPFIGPSPEEYLYLAWNLIRYEITKRDYRDWRNTALGLKNSKMHVNGFNHSISYGMFKWRKMFVYLLMPFVKALATEAEYKEYKKEPVRYLMSLKSKRYLLVRRILFPQ